MAARTLLVAGMVVVAAAAVGAAEKYTTKFDNVNLEDILKNNRLLDNYFKCVMGRGKCTPDGEELKKNLPEALKTNCEKCSERQRKGADEVLKFIHDKKPAMWKELEAKFDPAGKYKQMYKKQAEKAGIKV